MSPEDTQEVGHGPDLPATGLQHRPPCPKGLSPGLTEQTWEGKRVSTQTCGKQAASPHRWASPTAGSPNKPRNMRPARGHEPPMGSEGRPPGGPAGPCVAR